MGWDCMNEGGLRFWGGRGGYWITLLMSEAGIYAAALCLSLSLSPPVQSPLWTSSPSASLQCWLWVVWWPEIAACQTAGTDNRTCAHDNNQWQQQTEHLVSATLLTLLQKKKNVFICKLCLTVSRCVLELHLPCTRWVLEAYRSARPSRSALWQRGRQGSRESAGRPPSWSCWCGTGLVPAYIAPVPRGDQRWGRTDTDIVALFQYPQHIQFGLTLQLVPTSCRPFTNALVNVKLNIVGYQHWTIILTLNHRVGLFQSTMLCSGMITCYWASLLRSLADLKTYL